MCYLILQRQIADKLEFWLYLLGIPLLQTHTSGKSYPYRILQGQERIQGGRGSPPPRRQMHETFVVERWYTPTYKVQSEGVMTFFLLFT